MEHHRWTYNKTINHISLTTHHQRIVERTWLMVNSCKYMGVQHTGKNIPKQFSKSYLLIFSDELNILADAMENHLGLRYTTHLINCHYHQKGSNAVCTSTVNIDFLRLQPIRKKYRRFNKVQIMRVIGNRQECAKQNNGWLCSTDFQRKDSKYRKRMRRNDKTKTKITTWIISPSPYCLLITKGRRWK